MSKEYTIKLYERDALQGIIHCRAGANLLHVLQRQGYLEAVPCGGKGVCGECGVQIVRGAPLPGNGDRTHFSPQQLRSGMRLSCTVHASCDMDVVLQKQREDPTVLLRTTLRHDSGTEDDAGKNEVYGAVGEMVSVGAPETSGNLPGAILTADIGTTTIAMELKCTADGRTLGQYAALNPQRRFGADVLSRIEAAVRSKDTAELLKQQLHTVIRQGICYFEETVPEWMTEDTPVFLAGNTTMEHLFMGHSVETLGSYPFTPVSLDWQETECGGHKVILLPGFSAFVGADIAAGALALRMLEAEAVPLRTRASGADTTQEQPHTGNMLLIDLGTNAEMVYVHDNRITVTATAAGPAFEGGITAGVFGADLIEIAADLLERGILDETGLLQGEAFEQGAVIAEHSANHLSGIRIKQEDIRQLQLAKAAVAAGIELLGVSEDTNVYLAGGFGYYLNPDSACRIGLLPGMFKERIQAVGNIVPTGIFTAAGRYLADPAYAGRVTARLGAAEVVNLAEEPGFNEVFLRHLNFG